MSVNATQVNWSGNRNVDPKHKAAHDAPRSQKYWDENNIERPDYAKTDAEIAAERQQNGDRSSWYTWWGSFMIIVYATFAITAITAIVYAACTGDWSIILNNPLTAFVNKCLIRLLSAGGMKGHKLGTSGDELTSIQDNVSEGEKRRLARLARFENQGTGRDLLDDMKED